MFGKSHPTLLGNRERGVGFTTDKLLFRHNIAQFLQILGMTSQVTVGKFEQRFKRSEIDFVVDHKNGHNAEAHLALKSLIYVI